ncbi:unnamed protein product [Aspergillus oryzae]|uniref:Unnamed protein product n=2 Tax=Aspergillus oryzae TaxID=5062 RepID=A0AAN4YG54_ASPOZ|nr:unnamed protein product [Aspergillus oryzae]GMF92887.1 unnamed protein product [Aspergillus oryzae]GMG09187.1 unnamed protein product [Aspergillus oryzae]GMG25992.1 unnamed protein product [Aspergillus oryzae]GMG45358.1 unnamed protein product [Aspergillus oryzae var. brunneus]
MIRMVWVVLTFRGSVVGDGSSRCEEDPIKKLNTKGMVSDAGSWMCIILFLMGHDTCSRITSYSEQTKCYIAEIVKLSETLSIVWEDMVDVVTVDRMQGHELDMIILDWVFDSGTKSDL